jgi:hypothetical protein
VWIEKGKKPSRMGIFLGRNSGCMTHNTLKHREDLLAVNPQVQERIALNAWVI